MRKVVLTPKLSDVYTQTVAGSRDVTVQDAVLVYDELRGIARQLLAGERIGQSIGATDLVHIALTKLDGSQVELTFNDQRHLVNAFRLVMRRLLIDRSRRAPRPAAASGLEVEVEQIVHKAIGQKRLEDVRDALDRLRSELPLHADIVEFKCYCGLTELQIAEAMGISEATVRRYWKAARTWLHTAITERETSSGLA